MNCNVDKKEAKVVIVGGGFGGLYTAKALKQSSVQVTLIDKRNFHLFQPLLYQVATGGLSPSDIASPLRLILRQHKNVQVLLNSVVDLKPKDKQIILDDDKSISYDILILATGSTHHYFGNDQWENHAPGLSTVEDALEIRNRVFGAFEAAEKENDPIKRQAWLTFVIVGGGPTGVELAGAVAEIVNSSMKGNFNNFTPKDAKIILIEGLERVLPPYPTELSSKAEQELCNLGVTIHTQSMVTSISENNIVLRKGEKYEQITSHTILWAAGVKASSIGKKLAEKTGAQIDRAGRVIVEPDLSIIGFPDIFVIGDLSSFSHQNNKPLPGIAPVAMQQAKYVAKLIQKQLKGESLPSFVYKDYGSMAVIGKNKAVADFKFIKLSGFLAWFIWIWVHIYYLIEFDNKLVVLIQWIWNYFTQGRGSSVIIENNKKDK
ncbi:NAD(P)/FAD-dependent oxidoreductase [Candidatus Atelocyanobacterium thalassae]|jgi:NADH dehydrogenase|uniref:NADH:ubiquinone reductase (non-electrogenic) n=1 Tax=Atelocyanobacterium thalassa (isolate ALOHA) TaxID=1453429 RepID=D3EP16_ATETH|nr:NAD(P)/FAD-dependent oxidoreductase [Candidatus Atelocyanobacterium thalassa]ADB95216.1 NADH dehydrogenase, FAD-containing subunit [Candidatus Atelocyanobacterium thalassa isolate ALOHA]MCH2543849.1 NAD(P)/FAD-dependent oxidoreductase [Candidatus Atelocyanobacterium sp. ALOHA_A2.5_9]|tara:strand:+ start:94923 stop:96221 length:1299 start_codon:yes stop_codon:yes gene_type:complete